MTGFEQDAFALSGSLSEPNKIPYQPQRLSEEQVDLFEKMRKWRYDRARHQIIPAYMICTNRELEQIVKTLPSTLEQLLSMKVLSDAKMKNHGPAIVSALKRCATEKNNSKPKTIPNRKN